MFLSFVQKMVFTLLYKLNEYQMKLKHTFIDNKYHKDVNITFTNDICKLFDHLLTNRKKESIEYYEYTDDLNLTQMFLKQICTLNCEEEKLKLVKAIKEIFGTIETEISRKEIIFSDIDLQNFYAAKICIGEYFSIFFSEGNASAPDEIFKLSQEINFLGIFADYKEKCLYKVRRNVKTTQRKMCKNENFILKIEKRNEVLGNVLSKVIHAKNQINIHDQEVVKMVKKEIYLNIKMIESIIDTCLKDQTHKNLIDGFTHSKNLLKQIKLECEGKANNIMTLSFINNEIRDVVSEYNKYSDEFNKYKNILKVIQSDEAFCVKEAFHARNRQISAFSKIFNIESNKKQQLGNILGWKFDGIF
ncbi:hypothetical protein EDEG_02516 [Edhazardia aedis USNM 41457]|uniref:Uncharacterized protein n=1 Tax=Edhazardia aedis (strain USNM 41457) TaxID=1003232 RepID=J8ZTY5_EDHAE|nr:hypothetical protein EDEG_02516 [Edhazardia aedis USNM 41457]|eukprot:EJW03108.1 hypothetical protein EDEG_02516 [Edhazardia aedis USNM 41457]